MKKLPFYLLCVGMLAASTVVSCVKNDESASVTNLRNAKTEQLQSIAAMNLATAKATEIKAVAEVKLAEAKAAFELSLAAVQNANAAEKQVAVDLAKATLAKDIEAALLQADAAIEDAKLAFIKALNAYNVHVAANPSPFLDALVEIYKDQMDSLYDAITAVSDGKAALIRLRANVITAQAWLAAETAKGNKAVVSAQVKLDAYNAIPANDRMAIDKAQQEAEAKVHTIKSGLNTVVDPVNATNAAVAANIKLSDATAYVVAVDAAVDANGLEYTYVDYAGVESAEETSSIAVGVGGTAVAEASSKSLTMKNITTTAAVPPATLPTYTPDNDTKSYKTVEVDAILLNQQISKLTGGLVAPKTAYEDAVKVAEGTGASKKTLAELKAAVVEAQADYNKALVAGDAAKISTAETALNDAKGKVTAFDNAVSTQYDAWAKATAELAAWNAWGAELSATNKTAYDAAVKAITDEFAKHEAACEAYDEVKDNATTQGTIAADLKALYDGLVDKDALVAEATATLNTVKAKLAELVNATDAPDAKEAALAIANKEVADAEFELAVIQKKVDTLKAQIDAELKK